ncbi:RNase adapter RapZ [Pseudogemmobacter faecipullorum]|uniref:RNase adapter RapZ n=1 Tax=Pseudogemmobacter faecipullorum TaxID=2755041 RepID=A0ABS8CNK7_9RHOB|nr:RNase adapter RapZ [Pseudogemmobacter faecipullorum]MCB5410973.1 RNase adapter RapZ [Pseudogemmobacter faecipullorum]
MGEGPEISVVFVTGPSGAGRTTAVHVLEDLGYEVVDNIPLSLVPRLLEGAPPERPIALGLDIRNRDFNAGALVELIDTMGRNPAVVLQVLYLDCEAGELVRRYSETRRRHPLAGDSPDQGVEREIDLLAPIRARADHLIDTTDLSPHDLKAELSRWFDLGGSGRLAVSVQSFSYRRGLPRGVDMVFDCRFLNNPHWQPHLRDFDGRAPEVLAYLRTDPNFEPFVRKLQDLIGFLLPAHLQEGKAHLAIAFGCTGGKHRSVALAELIGTALAQEGWPVSKRHRELERKAAANAAPAGKVSDS